MTLFYMSLIATSIFFSGGLSASANRRAAGVCLGAAAVAAILVLTGVIE